MNHSYDSYTEYIDTFKWEYGITPLSSYSALLIVPIYFTVLYCTHYYVTNIRRKAYDLNNIVIIHNSLLSIGSGVLFIAIVSELYHLITTTSFWSVYCDPYGIHTTGRITYIYYVNYIFKYIELLDTVLLALRSKPMPFLHVYHHAATLVLCWSQLSAGSCVQWIPITINLFIHVVMYAYYTLHALRIDVWWKRYLTMLQITQFVVALIGCCGGLTFKMLANLGILESTQYNCHGDYSIAIFGLGILATYLILFIDLYNNSYKKNKKGSRKFSDVVQPVINESHDAHPHPHTNGKKQQ